MNQEKKEIDVLLNRGFKIEIKSQKLKVSKGFKGFFKPAEYEEVAEVLEFKEPTLAVLDLATAEYLSLEIFEGSKDESSAQVIANANKTVKANAEKMARIIAIFALGENCFCKFGNVYEVNEIKINELAKKVFHALTPGNLEKIISLCTALSNLPGFLNSIRLTGASRTTKTAGLVE